MLTEPEFSEYIEQLSEYVDYEDTEVGEYWATLVTLEREMDYMSTPFKKAYQTEVVDTLKFIKENYRWEEKFETPLPQKGRIVKRLKWIGDE